MEEQLKLIDDIVETSRRCRQLLEDKTFGNCNNKIISKL